MDIYQISWTCSECKAENKLIITDTVRSSACPECFTGSLGALKFQGAVYVLSNPRVDGVKIGMTRGDVWRRAKKISGTGVPGNFKVVAIFASHRPLQDESKVHRKLQRYWIDKEHFSLEPASAIAKVRTALGGREPVFVDKSCGREFEAIVEEQRAVAAQRFRGPSNGDEANTRITESQSSAASRYKDGDLFNQADQS